MSNPKQHDPEETKEEKAARIIDAASEKFADRSDLFVRTLRSNARNLTPYKRQITSAWLKRHCERLQSTLERRERRRQEAELDRLRALLAARNGNGSIEWLWPNVYEEEEQR